MHPYEGAFEKGSGGLRRCKVADQRTVERRSSVVNRRTSKMDRRQFIDIGWEMDKERRAASGDRRLGLEDRREE